MVDLTGYIANLETRLAALEASPEPALRWLVVGLDDASMILLGDGAGLRLGGYPTADIGHAFCTTDRTVAEHAMLRLQSKLGAVGSKDRAAIHTAREARLAAIEGARTTLATLRAAAA